MTTLREAAQQALEALTAYSPMPVDGPWHKRHHKAIHTLRAALELPEQEVKGCDHCNHPLYAAIKCRVCGRVTEQEQEPVAWMLYDGQVFEANRCDYHDGAEWTPLYTHSPRREWRGLTTAEIDEISDRIERSNFFDIVIPFARAIEAALKGRNV
jgi:recombinational DNA repair protein RecR